MATTLTVQQKIPLAAGMNLTFGSYATDGSTVATLQVSGGNVVSVLVYDNNGNVLNANSATSTVALSAKSTTGNLTSITLTPGGAAVSAGSFEVKHGGS